MEPIDSSPSDEMTTLARPRCVAPRGLSRAFSTYTLTIKTTLPGDFYGFLYGSPHLLTASVTGHSLRPDGHLVKGSALKKACEAEEWYGREWHAELSGNPPGFRKYLLSKVEAGDPVDDVRVGSSYSNYGFAHSPAYPWDETFAK
ncbi:unnamed protein product [Vitrella brassicaformis CCMP3155]|uniref:Uncharacterized protein n=1 Tax=Vitrella brassicaformis (strain CCMP3155) TaxID=1169540 RepID=A0A0G4G9X1_VITBC|nr:unnamed protein product [Vitrella brassicaformis CCMP3155]|eukprot:CEM25818.1 unnamed protein product [Vitrella brassicaformis CCMP3155]